MTRKDRTERLAETVDMYTKLRGLGLADDPDVAKFKCDCQGFVRDGEPVSDKVLVRSLNRFLRYTLVSKKGQESVAVIETDRD